MTTRYEVVKANTREEALQRSKYQVNDLVRVVDVEAVANCNGTWSVFPIIEPIQKLSGGGHTTDITKR